MELIFLQECQLSQTDRNKSAADAVNFQGKRKDELAALRCGK